jgi:hypothetical protein
MIKSSLVAIASIGTFTSLTLLASPSIAGPCLFGKLKNSEVVNAKMNHLAIVGGGLATVGGLLAGGIALKNRSARKNNSLNAEMSEEKSFSHSNFAIVVPPEALTSRNLREEASDSEKTIANN